MQQLHLSFGQGGKRFIAVLMAFVLAVTLVPAPAFADAASDSGTSTSDTTATDGSDSGTSKTTTKKTTKKKKVKAKTKKQLLSQLDKLSSSKSLKAYNLKGYNLKKTKAGKKLLAYVKQLRKRYKISIVMIDLKTGMGVSAAPKRVMYSASCLKGPYVASLNRWKPSSRKGSAGMMRSTIVQSNNNTYSALRNRYGSGTMKKMLSYSKVSSISYARKYSYLPVKDLAKLWVGTYWTFYKDTNKNSKWARSLYTHGTQSFIYQGMKGKFKVHAKPGWFPGGGFNVQNDSGVVMAKVNGKSRPYVLTVMTSACGQQKKLQKLVKLIDAVHTDMVKYESKKA